MHKLIMETIFINFKLFKLALSRNNLLGSKNDSVFINKFSQCQQRRGAELHN